VGSILQGISGMVIAIVLGIYFNWKLGTSSMYILFSMVNMGFLPHFEK
jgi:hypothetical protein